ncbi:calcium-binding protein [Nakamurella silvestris]|nr:calcium-binding protein [Nakamurella silvestris]
MLRRHAFVSAALAVLISVGTVAAPVAEAAAVKPRVFATCKEMNKVYPHGVGKVGAKDKSKSKNPRPVTNFKRDNALYKANVKRDADKDGIACEKR